MAVSTTDPMAVPTADPIDAPGTVPAAALILLVVGGCIAFFLLVRTICGGRKAKSVRTDPDFERRVANDSFPSGVRGSHEAAALGNALFDSLDDDDFEELKPAFKTRGSLIDGI